jgi:hypothetical protein
VKKIFVLLIAVIACSQAAFSQQKRKSNTTTNERKDNRIKNATAAKKPMGKMSYVVNGTPVVIQPNTVQCMYIGMNSSMAQSVISGGNKVVIIHMEIPKVGPVEINMVAGVSPSVGIQVIVNGVQYNNKKAEDATFTLTRVKPDGKNWYVAGTFSGTLTSRDGNTITVTNGVFESAYAR